MNFIHYANQDRNFYNTGRWKNCICVNSNSLPCFKIFYINTNVTIEALNRFF